MPPSRILCLSLRGHRVSEAEATFDAWSLLKPYLLRARRQDGPLPTQNTSPCKVYLTTAILGRIPGVGWKMEFSGFPKCQKCKTGDLVPLSDFGSQGAAIHYKAWVCTNPDCGFNLKIRNGDLYIDEPISSGAVHAPRTRY